MKKIEENALEAVEIAKQEMKEKSIEAFKKATSGYFIIGGVDYSQKILDEFINELNK